MRELNRTASAERRATTFGQQIKVAPMFGVDLNAGRGPDQLRFFTGFAVRIRGLGP